MGKRSSINSGAYGIVAFFLLGGIVLLYFVPTLGYIGIGVAAVLIVFLIFSRVIR